eukprot:1159632-Pelagomonas_calceolata.AAC.3
MIRGPALRLDPAFGVCPLSAGWPSWALPVNAVFSAVLHSECRMALMGPPCQCSVLSAVLH